MTKLGNYEMIGQMTNQDSGYSAWGFGMKDGAEYFVKEFMSPKYPENDNVSSPERVERRKRICRRFEDQKTALYRVVNENSDGNAVRIHEFFRLGSKYYIAMPKIEAQPMDVSQICTLPRAEIRRLCAIIAHSLAGLHRGGLVHADLKPTNILFTTTWTGQQTVKLIDFDSSFLESDPPALGDDIVGDPIYFSPEACMCMWEEEVMLTSKMDIFALGVLFHQYFTGELPGFDREQNSCPGESVAKGVALKLADSLPEDVMLLLQQMLDGNPELRPMAEDVFLALCPRPDVYRREEEERLRREEEERCRREEEQRRIEEARQWLEEKRKAEEEEARKAWEDALHGMAQTGFGKAGDL